jgi:hypothetical protein
MVDMRAASWLARYGDASSVASSPGYLAAHIGSNRTLDKISNAVRGLDRRRGVYQSAKCPMGQMTGKPVGGTAILHLAG